MITNISTAAGTFEDQILSCRDCHQPFVFSYGEQEFYALKNLSNKPKRCSNCRVNQTLVRNGKDPSICTEVSCHDCGAATRVPFKPTGEKPIYCSPCLHKNKNGAVAS